MTGRRRRVGIKDIHDVIAELNWCCGGAVPTCVPATAADKIVQVDRYVAWRLKRLRMKRKGRDLRAGEADQWTPDWLWGLGLHRLMGTILYPGTA